MPLRIVTDSTCDLPERVVARHNISVVPLYINIGHQEYLDGIDMLREDFYRQLPFLHSQPTTAVPSPMKFKAVYNALTDQGATEILSIHISKTLSAVLDMAQLAASETRSVSVTVLDSRQLSLGTGFLVETAACLAESGATLAEVLPILQEQIKRTHVFAALDTLHFLSRSGRMNSVISSIGELLQVKPILKMYDGVSSAERVRTRKGAIMRLIEFLHENGPFDKAALLHSDAMERASELLEVVRPLFPNGEVWLEQINPVLGAHIGPGVLGFALISKARI